MLISLLSPTSPKVHMSPTSSPKISGKKKKKTISWFWNLAYPPRFHMIYLILTGLNILSDHKAVYLQLLHKHFKTLRTPLQLLAWLSTALSSYHERHSKCSHSCYRKMCHAHCLGSLLASQWPLLYCYTVVVFDSKLPCREMIPVRDPEGKYK